MGVITVDACAGYAYAAGFRGSALVTIVAIAGPESGYDTTSHDDNIHTGDDSYGLWQINMLGSLGPARRKQFAISNDHQLFDPATNARAAWSVSGGGNNFKPWSTFNQGLHRKFLPAAQAAANSVTARNGGTTSGTPSLEANTTGVIAGETLPPGGNLGFGIAPVNPLFPIVDLAGGKSDELDRLSRMGVSGSVQMPVSAVTQVQMTFPDPLGDIQTWRYFLLRAGVRLNDLDLVVAANEWADLNGVPGFTVTFRPRGVDYLRSTDPKGNSVMWSNMSPTEVLSERARSAGLRFYGKGTAQRTQITRVGVDDTNASTSSATGTKVAETDWDMGHRLAKEEGFWFFESVGALYFAPPTWLAAHATTFEARYRSTRAELIWEVLAFPNARSTLDDNPYGRRQVTRTITLQMPRWRGEQVRPGMQCNFTGIPGYDRKLDGTGPALWIVTNVSWPFDGGVSPVTVELTEAVDPVPQPNAADSTATDGTTDTFTTLGTAASADGVNAPTKSGVSNMGKGSYGYQYDKTGSVPATGDQPGAIVLMAHLLSKFKGTTNNGIFDNRRVSGTDHLSAHAEGRAGDTGVPTRSALGDSVAAYLEVHASLFGLQCIIWNARIWLSTTRKWNVYKSADGHTDDSSLHRNHVHWELCWEAARYLNQGAIDGAIAHHTDTTPGAVAAGGGGGGGGSW